MGLGFGLGLGLGLGLELGLGLGLGSVDLVDIGALVEQPACALQASGSAGLHQDRAPLSMHVCDVRAWLGLEVGLELGLGLEVGLGSEAGVG